MARKRIKSRTNPWEPIAFSSPTHVPTPLESFLLYMFLLTPYIVTLIGAYIEHGLPGLMKVAGIYLAFVFAFFTVFFIKQKS